MAAARPRRSGKKKEKKNVPVGVVHIQATFNNTIITFSDLKGNVVSWASAGGTGFKGSRKSTPFAAQMAADTAASKAMDNGMRTVGILVKGPVQAARPPCAPSTMRASRSASSVT